MITIPAALAERSSLGEGWSAWLDHLPALVEDLMTEWGLAADGAATNGSTALVIPVRHGAARAMLKIGWPHPESEHEHLALQHWHGQGAVHLIRADPRRGALLLERLGPRDLTSVDPIEACEIVADLYRPLHVRPAPQLRRLTSYVEELGTTLTALPRNSPVPRRLVEHASALCRDFATDPQTDGVAIHTDLHYDNVLAATRAPWLAIDPKPLNGDPHYEPAPMLWNRFAEWDSDVRHAVRRRFHTLIDTANLDEDRARDWVIVRAVAHATSFLKAAPLLSQQDQDVITASITIAKAVQD